MYKNYRAHTKLLLNQYICICLQELLSNTETCMMDKGLSTSRNVILVLHCKKHTRTLNNDKTRDRLIYRWAGIWVLLIYRYQPSIGVDKTLLSSSCIQTTCTMNQVKTFIYEVIHKKSQTVQFLQNPNWKTSWIFRGFE